MNGKVKRHDFKLFRLPCILLYAVYTCGGGGGGDGVFVQLMHKRCWTFFFFCYFAHLEILLEVAERNGSVCLCVCGESISLFHSCD